jgi:hypothetical protein
MVLLLLLALCEEFLTTQMGRSKVQGLLKRRGWWFWLLPRTCCFVSLRWPPSRAVFAKRGPVSNQCNQKMFALCFPWKLRLPCTTSTRKFDYGLYTVVIEWVTSPSPASSTRVSLFIADTTWAHGCLVMCGCWFRVGPDCVCCQLRDDVDFE